MEEDKLNIAPLDSLVVADYDKKESEDFHTNTANFLQNAELHEDISGINYSKIGGLYFLSGTVEFTENKMDILPEPAKTDGFFNTSTSETVQLTAGSTEIEATSTGIKVISGFYAAKEQEH